MSYVLLQYEDHWGDEMTVEGFAVATSEHWGKCREVLADRGCFDFGIGSNQSIEYYSGNDFMKRIRVCEITEADAKRYERHFGKYDHNAIVVKFGQDFLCITDDYIPA